MDKKKKINFVQSKTFVMLIVLFLFILILAFFFGDSGIMEVVKTQWKIEDLRTNLKSLESEKVGLEKDIQQLKSNPIALEKKAREKLWLMKKNEKVIVIIEEKKREE